MLLTRIYTNGGITFVENRAEPRYEAMNAPPGIHLRPGMLG
jgi:hypothetical protein